MTKVNLDMERTPDTIHHSENKWEYQYIFWKNIKSLLTFVYTVHNLMVPK